MIKPGTFSQGVAKWTAKSSEEIKKVNREVVFRLYGAVIGDTPVLEGRLRGNWFPTLGQPSAGVDGTFNGNEDAATQHSMDRVDQFLVEFNSEKDFVVFLTNNLPYANRIEYEGHSSVKAPAGMVRKNVNRMTEILDKARAKLR